MLRAFSKHKLMRWRRMFSSSSSASSSSESIGNDGGLSHWKASVASHIATNNSEPLTVSSSSSYSPLHLIWNTSMLKDELQMAAQAYQSAFSSSTVLNTVAVKANPYLPLMNIVREQGFGFESASRGELQQSLRVQGIDSNALVFDSPTKTQTELTFALQSGVHLNVDNFQELGVLHDVLTRVEGLDVDTEASPDTTRRIGVRVNPEIGSGSIDTHSTSEPWSKFGIGLLQYENELIEAFAQRPYLRMLHCHAGSQGVSNAQFGEALKRTVDLANAINSRVDARQVDTIDIGGGISVDFDSEDHTTSVAEYLSEVQAVCPDLFDGRFRTVLTENGRRYFSKTGVVMSRVEYTKRAGPRYVALQHAGADLFLRSVYHPQTWPLRVTVVGADGTAKPMDGELFEYDIGGPCCIAGDVIAHRRKLPWIERGDWLLIHDVGAYMHSSWSYYNSRQAPALHFAERKEEDEETYVTTLSKSQATVDETLSFFC